MKKRNPIIHALSLSAITLLQPIRQCPHPIKIPIKLLLSVHMPMHGAINLLPSVTMYTQKAILLSLSVQTTGILLLQKSLTAWMAKRLKRFIETIPAMRCRLATILKPFPAKQQLPSVQNLKQQENCLPPSARVHTPKASPLPHSVWARKPPKATLWQSVLAVRLQPMQPKSTKLLSTI